MPRAITLKDSASSPSWSLLRTRISWLKSPCRSLLGAHGQRVDAAGDRARQQQAQQQRDGVDHQEDDAHDRERLHQQVGHVERAGREVADQVEG